MCCRLHLSRPAVRASVQVVACVSGSENSSARANEQFCPLRLTLLPSIGSAGLEPVARELRLDEVNEAQCTRLSDGQCSVELRSPPIGAPLYLLLNVTHPQLVLNVTLRLALVGTRTYVQYSVQYTKRGLSNVPAVMFSFAVYTLRVQAFRLRPRIVNLEKCRIA